ncbi:MAG: hypothetical protein ABIO24_08985 [Saprospiraceae bacterium]
MTQERFIKLLDNPALLTTISYEELKTLALAYPYAHNLRTLLALKAQQTGHPEAARTLAAAAAYSLDRTRLFVVLAPKIMSPQRLEAIREEVLELKPIETVQRELDALAPLMREEQTGQSRPSLALQPPPPNKPEVAADLILDFSQALPATEPAVVAPPEPVPAAPTQPFASWMDQFQLPTLEPRPVRPAPPAPVPKPEPAPKTSIAHVLAEKSVSANKDVLSETLAKLYAQQGHREKAINMYQRLSLAFPEKSTYFAAEIEKL